MEWSYLAVLLFVAGLMNLVFDIKDYKHRKMSKELKTARVLGWINISLSLAVFLGKWVKENYFW